MIALSLRYLRAGALAVQASSREDNDTALAAQQTAPPEESFADSLVAGLGKTPKEIPCKYFYDQEGSQLFEQICALPEYYQTRTETVLLERHAGEIAQLMGDGCRDRGIRRRRLAESAHPARYTAAVPAYSPLDISGDYLREVVSKLAAEYPALHLRPLIGDFTLPLEIAALAGNAAPRRFLPRLAPSAISAPTPPWRCCGACAPFWTGGGLLIGVDLVKDPARLHAAYNDAAGVTALFNKNLLARANRELGADFDLDAFAHYAPYNAAAHRIEMYLVSLKRQSVTLMGQRFDFAAGEAVHTEDSHKYTIESLPRDGGARRLQAAGGMDRSRTAVLAALAGKLLTFVKAQLSWPANAGHPDDTGASLSESRGPSWMARTSPAALRRTIGPALGRERFWQAVRTELKTPAIFTSTG